MDNQDRIYGNPCGQELGRIPLDNADDLVVHDVTEHANDDDDKEASEHADEYEEESSSDSPEHGILEGNNDDAIAEEEEAESFNEEDQQTDNISSPEVVLSPYLDDVIGGRGKQANNHLGNHNFRRLIRDNCQEYHAIKGNAQKSAFVDSIFGRVRQTGRFLKRKAGEQGFVEMQDDEVKRKVGQSLRYEYRKLKAQNEDAST